MLKFLIDLFHDVLIMLFYLTIVVGGSLFGMFLGTLIGGVAPVVCLGIAAVVSVLIAGKIVNFFNLELRI